MTAATTRCRGVAVVAALACVTAGATAFMALHRPRAQSDAGLRLEILGGAGSLDSALADLRARAVRGEDVRVPFRRARVAYKHVEGVIEFYAPALAAAFNSRRQEVDDDDAPPPSSLAPSGFPALETFVFAAEMPARADSLALAAARMRTLIPRVTGLASAISPTAAQRFEIARQELIRVATLGIAGFDTPRSRDAMRESAEAAASVWSLLPGEVQESRDRDADALRAALSDAAAYLREHDDFASFDRLEYIARYSEPALRALMALRDARHVPPIMMRRALRADVASPYAANAFDPLAYAPRATPAPDDRLISLGQRLFLDPRLSGTGTRSCASCHQPARAFTDGLARAAPLEGNGGLVARHTPTLLNAALQPRQFADERAVSLEDQALLVLANPAEMGSSAERAAHAIEHDSSYRVQFARAFRVDSAAVSALRLRQALAAYVRSLVRLDSRFDRAVRGDAGALSAEERNGFNLFMGKAGCGTCHFAPLFSGVTPPLFVNSDVEVIGTPRSPADFRVLDPDSGRGGIDRLPLHLRAFRTPTLRNAAVGGRFMHNGAFRSLDDVLRFYDGGGGAGAGARVPNQTLAADSLHLTPRERAAIVAFLGSLTDTTYVRR